MTAYWDPELETMPWAELRRWQAGQAGAWLAALPGRSRFHQDKLAGARLPERPTDPGFLPDLPFTTKEELRVSQQEGQPGEPFGRHQGVPLVDVTQMLSSSGTTGDPLSFALTAADLEVWREGIATGFYAAGVRDHDVVAHLVGLPGVAGGLPYADGFRRIGAALAWIGGRPTEQIVRSIPRLQATTVLATSSFGTYLADRCRELTGSDASSLGVRSLLGGGEPGLAQPEIREKVREGWGLERVHEVMGLGDVMSLLWAECEDEGGMHFCGQRSVIVELVDPATGAVVPWREGAEGEAVYTTFAREATPVLRYRSADHMVVTATACPCGRTAPRVRCVGRTDDMLIYKAMNVFPSAIRDVVLDRFPGSVEPYLRIWKDDPRQVRFDDPIAVDVEASRELPAERYRDIAASIERELRARLQVQTTVTLLEPGALPRTAYKTPLVHVRDGGA
jgi:phenylacetate-coenzyme A ligase PaaK-like adenylate-forming protein